MKPIVPFIVALVALAAPALAAPEGTIDPRWDKDLSRALAKLKVGMDANQVQHVFSTIEPQKLMDGVDYRSKIVQVFNVSSTKQRVYLNANFYEVGKTQTPHKAILIFQTPKDEYRGNLAKLLKWGMTENFTWDIYLPVPTADVATLADVYKQQRFKF